MKACFWNVTRGPGLRREDGSGGNTPSTCHRVMKSSSIALIPNEAALRLYPRQSEKRNALHRCDFRSSATHMATQERPGRGVQQEIQCSCAGLVRTPCNDGIGHHPRKSDQGMAAGLENQAHRIRQPAVARSLRRDRLMRAFWTPAFAGVTAESRAFIPLRHSGAGRNPGIRSTNWISAFAGTTELRCVP